MRAERKKQKEEENRQALQRMHEQLRQKKYLEEAVKLGMDEKTYMRIKNRELGLPSAEERHMKVTLEDLEKMNYKDIWENKADDFRPNDFII